MKINLTSEALLQLSVISEDCVGTVDNGFILGSVMGKQIIIQQLFPINFNEATIDKIYPGIIDKMGERLLGVFFNNQPPFESEWFSEDIILKIDKNDRYEVYTPLWNKN
ncbi:MAG: hypothetical protein GY757_05750 [bacterium]|nr:hypothetical protein [bacterium]